MHNIRPYNPHTFRSKLHTFWICNIVAKHASNQLTWQILKIGAQSTVDGCYFVIIQGRYGI